MDRDTVIALARKSEGEEQQHGMWRMHVEDLERFAALIEEHLTWSSIHTCNPECTKPACVAVRKAVEAEREACAKLAGDFAVDLDDVWVCEKLAAAIRSRK